MPRPAFVRLAVGSASLLNELAQAPSGLHPLPVSFTCAQVPKEFEPGSLVWVWLGSDNKKGAKTSWTQGIRALASCQSKKTVSGKQYEIVLEDIVILPETIEKRDLLSFSPSTYAKELADAPIVGLNNYASQVVQILDDREFYTIAAMIAEMSPDVQEDILARVPEATAIELEKIDGTTTKAGPPSEPLELQLDENDTVLAEVRRLLFDDGWGGVLLTGAPGTGKSWYARQIAIALTDGERRRIREVQFHPSYQYEDFVEGYVPDGRQGFRLTDKHVLQMSALAQREGKIVVLVIDEFSRSDPARVLGETMTYMERTLRDVSFFLPSGREAIISSSLMFIATMNPEDRSVDEIDAAMERRWAKVTLLPDANKLREFLTQNGASPQVIGALIPFFLALQQYMELGHAFFRNVRDEASASRLWLHQLRHVIAKRYRYDPDTKREVEDLWNACRVSMMEAELNLDNGDGGPAEPNAR